MRRSAEPSVTTPSPSWPEPTSKASVARGAGNHPHLRWRLPLPADEPNLAVHGTAERGQLRLRMSRSVRLYSSSKTSDCFCERSMIVKQKHCRTYTGERGDGGQRAALASAADFS